MIIRTVAIPLGMITIVPITGMLMTTQITLTILLEKLTTIIHQITMVLNRIFP